MSNLRTLVAKLGLYPIEIMALIDLLERGYFPKELPNPFTTSSFANCVTSSGITLPTDFLIDRTTYRQMKKTKACRYSHSRGGLLRRLLNIPNPISQYILSREIENNWSALAPNISGTRVSATHPIHCPTGRAIKSASPQTDRRKRSVETRVNNRYILKTDISRFYHSIYTHSIPWAIHTKTVAKGNTHPNLLGNWIDIIVRNAQDKQTVGIPIGPDTSLVIAEILMQACDHALIKALPSLKGHRFIDDYELGFKTRTEAEDAFHILERILTTYELALNPKKTEIIELPFSLESSWVRPIRNTIIRTGAKAQEQDLYNYFDLIFDLKQKYPEDGLLQFGVARLRPVVLDSSNWELFQKFLLNCAIQEPATLPFVLELIISRVNAGAPAPINELEEVLSTIIEKHSCLLHSSEVAWSLWACLALQITLNSAATAAVSDCEDSVVALLALHCESLGLTSESLNKTLWSTFMDTAQLYDDQWLLSYEANIKGWLPSVGGVDHVNNDPNFRFLKTNGVSFYDTSLAIPTRTAAPLPITSKYQSIEELIEGTSP